MENLMGGTPPVRPLPCVVPCKLYFSKVKTKAMAMYLHVASGVFILDHSRCIPGCLLFKPFGVSEYDA